MTLYVNIGRRVPRNWFKRTAVRAKGLMSFQENIWMMIKSSFNLMKKKAKNHESITIVIKNEEENEDINFKIEWIKVITQGTPAEEQEELEEANKFYEPFGLMFKDKLPVDDELKKHFKTKVLTSARVDEAYKKGYGAVSSSNISNKLLEMGILMDIQLVEDYDTRDVSMPKK